VVFVGVAVELWLALRQRSMVLLALRRSREEAYAGDAP
jgi:hypothetical protein